MLFKPPVATQHLSPITIVVGSRHTVVQCFQSIFLAAWTKHVPPVAHLLALIFTRTVVRRWVTSLHKINPDLFLPVSCFILLKQQKHCKQFATGSSLNIWGGVFFLNTRVLLLFIVLCVYVWVCVKYSRAVKGSNLPVVSPPRCYTLASSTPWPTGALKNSNDTLVSPTMYQHEWKITLTIPSLPLLSFLSRLGYTTLSLISVIIVNLYSGSSLFPRSFFLQKREYHKLILQMYSVL